MRKLIISDFAEYSCVMLQCDCFPLVCRPIAMLPLLLKSKSFRKVKVYRSSSGIAAKREWGKIWRKKMKKTLKRKRKDG